MATIDIAKELERKLGNLPKDSGDLNNICSVIYSQYTLKLKILQALVLPVSSMQNLLYEAIEALDEIYYNEIIDVLNHLDAAVEKTFPKKRRKGLLLNVDTVRVSNLLAVVCTDFFKSVPPALFNIMQDVENGILSPFNDLLDMPRALASDIFRQLEQSKEEALMSATGTLYDSIIFPFFEYQQFITGNAITVLLKELAAMEKCMTKPGICGRSRLDFIEPTSHKLWSQYYYEKFMISKNGNIRLKFLIPDNKEKYSRVKNLITRLNTYRASIKLK